jgi:hypothetical protein
MDKSSIRHLWKLACKWRRYRGYPHGNPGGIDVPTGPAMEASMRMPTVTGEDLLSKRYPGRFSGPYAVFFKP